MKHVKALLVKFAIIALILELTLINLSKLSFSNILVVSLAVTILAYIIGDLLILPRTNNTIATLADIGLSLVTLILFDYIIYKAGISFMTALLASVIIGFGEWFYHKYIIRLIEDKKEENKEAV